MVLPRVARAVAIQAGGSLASPAFVMQGGGSVALRSSALPASEASPASVSSPALSPPVDATRASSGAALALCSGLAAGALAAATLRGRSRRGKAVNTGLAAFESELGVQPPTGFWDPLGAAADGDWENFKRRRASEIKHGRISMLATMGYITPELTGKLPGGLTEDIKFSDIPNGLQAIGKVPALGWVQIFALCGFIELSGVKSNGYDGTEGTPGDFGWKLMTLSDPEANKRRLQAELANGRLAMMAIIGMFFQDGLTGSAWGDWALYTASPLR